MFNKYLLNVQSKHGNDYLLAEVNKDDVDVPHTFSEA